MRHYKHKLAKNKTKVTGFQHEIKKKNSIPTSYNPSKYKLSTNHTSHQGLQLQSILNGKHQMKVHL